ncbi:MAG: N-acetylmuramoyl-L-alanine amidase AmiC [Gammaproteobacteria bacterium]|nr:N-acetylmuramoyl-L-alanine amidase AmiC [Gammaproteobacteria bacterium]
MRLFTSLAALLMSLPVTALEVQNLRLWPAPDNTRVVFDISAPVQYEVFTIDNPHRVVIDLKATQVTKPLPQPDAAHRLLRAVRHGPKPDGGTRVVFDVTGPVVVRSALLKPNDRYGHRLLIELTNGPSRPSSHTLAALPPGSAAAAAVPKPETKAETREAGQVAMAPSPSAKPPAQVAGNGRSRDVIVAVDAGHGGEDPGAIGRKGTREKDVTLAIARRLAEEINRIEGMRAVLTRDGDYFIPLRRRIEKAREHRADMFVSVHADAYKDPDVAGSSVYVLSQRGASSEAARWLADRENSSDYIGGVTWDDKDSVLKSVLLDLSQTASMEASADVAEEVLDRLDRIGNVRKPQVQHAGFVVLKSPDIPSILVETAYLTNGAEERKLRTASHQKQLARAIADGMRQYFETTPPPGTLMAERRERRVASNP